MEGNVDRLWWGGSSHRADIAVVRSVGCAGVAICRQWILGHSYTLVTSDRNTSSFQQKLKSLFLCVFPFYNFYFKFCAGHPVTPDSSGPW